MGRLIAACLLALSLIVAGCPSNSVDSAGDVRGGDTSHPGVDTPSGGDVATPDVGPGDVPGKVPDTAVDAFVIEDVPVVPDVPVVEGLSCSVGTREGDRPTGQGEIVLGFVDEPASHAGTPGFQVDFRARLPKAAVGTRAKLSVAGERVAERDLTIDAATGDGTVVFEGVTLPHAPAGVTATITFSVAGEEVDACAGTLRIDLGECPVALLPAPTGECLGEDEDPAPGFQRRFTVRSVGGGCDRASIVFQVDSDPLQTSAVALDEAGEANFLLTLFPNTVSLNNESVTVTAVVTDSANPAREGRSAASVYDVDTEPPVVTITTPSGAAVTTAQDADEDPANGIQVVVRGTVRGVTPADGAALVLSVDGARVSQTVVDSSGAFAFPTITLAEEREYTITVSADDSCGASGQAQVTVRAETVAPTMVCGVVTRSGERGTGLGRVTVRLADEPDAYVEERGLQVDVHAVTTRVADGASAELTVDGETVAEAAVAVDAETGVGDVLFAAVTVPHAPEGFEIAVVVKENDVVRASCEGDVAVDMGPCPVDVRPLAGACLRTDEDPASGFQRRFTVRSVGGWCDEAALVWETAGDPVQTPPQPLDENGEASFLVTLSPTTVALNNEAALVVGVASDSAAPGREARSEPRVYTIDTQPPSVSITEPAHPVLTLADDEDGVAGNGLQLVVQGVASGVVPGDGTAVRLLVDGETVAETVAAPSGAFAFPAYTFLESGTYAITVTAGDTCGGHGEATRVVRVETVVPTLAVVAPVSGTTLWARDDGDRATSLRYEMTATVRAEDVAQGMTLRFRCRRDESGAPLLDVAEYAIAQVAADARYAFPVAFRADLLGTAQVCSVATDGDNPAQSPEVRLAIALPAPALQLTTPADGTLTNADDVTFGGATLHLDGRPLSTRLEDEAGAVVIEVASPDAIVDDAFSATFPFEVDGLPVPDGRYRLVVDATDALGNIASDQPESVVGAWVTLDRTPPAIAIPWPLADGLNPATDPNAADSDPDMPGYQTDVLVTLAGEAAPLAAEVCLSKDDVAVGCASPEVGDDGTAGVRFAAVTFQPGANALRVSATDEAGNDAEAVDLAVNLALDAPRVVISAPAAGLITLAAAVDVVVVVSDEAGGDGSGIGGIDGAEVTLLVGGAPAAVVAEALGDGQYRFAAVPLVAGVNGLRATAVAGGEEGVSDPISVTRKTAAPALSFTHPTDGAVLNRATSACASGSTDCVHDVTLAATDFEVGSPVTLTVDCGGDAVEHGATTEADKVVFPGVTLAHGAVCQLSATGTDAIDQVASAAPIAVSVDRVAPVLAEIQLPDVLQWTADLAPAEPGMQVSLVVTLAGVEADQTVSVGASNDLGEVVAHGFPLPADVPDGAPVTIDLGVVTLPEEFVEVTVDVTDAAGNAAATARHTVYVNSEEPDVRMLGPDLVPDDPCTTNADCSQGGACSAQGCARAWGAAAAFEVRVGLTGIASGVDALRVCSDHVDLAAAPACATAGFHEVARVDALADDQVVSLEGTLPEGFQVLVAEAEILPGTDEWARSLDGAVPFYQRRPVFVDTVPPQLLDLASSSDVEEPFGTLNIAEQAVAGGVYSLRAEASELGEVTFFVNGDEAETVAIDAGFAETIVGFAEGQNSVQARVTDRVGNTSDLLPLTPYAPIVDTVPPTLSFVYPDHSPVIAGESLDASLRSDAIGRDVTLRDGGVALGTAPVAANSIVLFVHEGFSALDDGDHTLTAEVRDAANNPRTAVTTPASVHVDTVPPAVAIASPAVGTTFGDADDVAPTQGGFQIDVRFTPTGALTWRVLLASGCDASFAGCGTPVERAAGAGADTEESFVLTVPVAGATTYHVLSVEARDENGNVTVESAPFTVDLVDCVVSLAGLPAGGVYNNALCAGTPGADCTTVADALTVSFALSCAGVDEIALYKGATRWIGTTAIDNQSGTLDVLLAHGDTFDLSARVLAAGAVVGDSGASPVRVDLRDPVPQFVAATVDGFITPATGDVVLYSVAHDQDPATANLVEIHARLTASDDGGLTGGAIQAIVRLSGGDPVALVPTNATLPKAIATAPFSGDFKNLALPVGAHTVVATVVDKAGNVATTSFAATIDNVAPIVHAIDLPDVLVAASDVRPGDGGMQISLGVTLEGVEAGQDVTVRAANAAGDTRTYAIALPAAAPDGAQTVFDLGIVTLPEGAVTVTVDVADVAGNAADTGTKSLYVTSLPPAVRITQPARVPNDACTTSAQCASGGVCSPQGCATSWGAASDRSVRVAIEGVAPGADDVRVCSDHASLAGGTACATPGFFELARASYAVSPVDVPLSAVVPDGFQILVAEAETVAGSGTWIRSIDATATNQRRHVYVDTLAPTVSGVVLPGDVQAPPGVLNVAEQAEAGRRYRVRVTASETGTATIRLNGAVAATAPVAGGVAEATVTFGEGANTLQASVTDLVGNGSGLFPATPVAVTVDTVLPTLAFLYPEHTPVLAGQALDVRLQSDAIGRTVTLYDGAPPASVGTATVAATGVALFPHATVGALSDGTHALSAQVMDAAGNPRGAVTSPASIAIDTTPPSVLVAAPVSGATYDDADDADPAQGGFQLTARFTPTGAETWILSLASGCDAAYANCGAPVELDSGAAADVEVARVISVPVAAATSYFVATVTARDPLGNTTQTDVPFTVQLANCVVTLEGLPGGGTYANALCEGTPGVDCGSVSDTLSVRFTLACVGADAVALYKGGTQFATTGAIDNQSAALDVTFAHGESFDLSARVLSGGVTVGDSGTTPVRVDLHDPAPLFVAADVGGFATAASGDSVAWGIADDQQPASADSAEVPVRLTATDDGVLVGGQVVSLERITGGTTVALTPTNVTLPYAIAAAPLQVDLLNLSLPVGGPHTIRATVRDKAGNAAVTEFTATVDLTAPVIASVDLPDHLDWTDDLDPGVAGMQVEVLVTLSGVEAGQEVDIVAAVSGGDVFSYAVAVGADVADGAPAQVSLGTLTLPEGEVTVTADVSDMAGNAAPQASATPYVNSDEPDVRMLLPTLVPNVACTTSADCATGGVCTASGCAAPWSAASTLGVSVGLIGVAPGSQSLRICSNHAAVVGNSPCATAGYHAVATADVTGAVVDVGLAGAVPQGFQILVAEAEPWAGGGGWVSSDGNPSALYRRRAVYVDTIMPTVIAVTSPSDTETPTGVLNIAEQFATGRKYRIRVTASEDGTAAFQVNGVQVASVPVVAGAAETTVTLAEGVNSIQANVSDLVGNLSGLRPTTPYAPSVDTVAPTLVFTGPNHSPLLAGDPLDVVLTSSAIGRTVTLFDGAVSVGTAPVGAGGTATFPHATFGVLSDGDHTLTAEVRDVANNPKAAATSPALVQVDTVPPGLTVAAPTVGQLFADADDADPATGGFQIAARFTPTAASTWSIDLASGCDAAHSNCGAAGVKASGAAGGVEVTRVVTVPVAEATSYHRLGFEAVDALGNVTRGEVPITVQLTNCVVSIAGLPSGGVYNNALCAGTPGADCDSVGDTLTVTYTTACVGTDELALYKGGVQFATTTTIVNQAAAFDVAFAHAETFDLSARALAGGATSGDSGGTPVRVDLHDPVPLFVAAVVDGFQTGASGDSVLYGIADDQQPASASSVEFHLRLTATDDVSMVGGRVASLYRTSTALVPSNVTLPYAIGAEPFSLDLKNLTLPDGGPYTIRVTVADGANNTATTAIIAEADTVRPGAVSLSSIPAADVSARRPSITVRWAAVADDGAAGVPASSYVVRYSYAPIGSDAAFDAACDVADLVPGLALPTPGAPGAAEEYTVDGPDARSPLDPCRLVTSMSARTVYVAVKAIDAAGNTSPLGVDSAKGTSDAHLRYATIAGDGGNVPAAVSWYTWAPGDLDGDGVNDMVLADLGSGMVCVVYGHADDAAFTFGDYLLDGPERAEHVCTTGWGYGYGVSVASDVDLNGDGVHDLVYGGGFLFNGVVRVHFGVSGGHVSPTPNLTISGMKASTFSSLWVAGAGNFDGDTAPDGTPIGDIVFEAGTEVGPEGRQTGAVYVLPGDASWGAATSLTMNVTNAGDRSTYRIARIAVQGTENTGTSPNFGWRVAGVGNLLVDGGANQYDDIAVVQRINDNTIYGIKGRPLVGAVDIFVTDLFSLPPTPLGEDAQVLRLVPEFGVTQTNFGKTVVAADLDGDGVSELLVGHPKGADDPVGGYSVYVFRGADVAAEIGKVYTRIGVFDPQQTEGDMLLGLRGFVLPGAYQSPTVLGDFDDEGGLSPDVALRMKSDTQWGEIYVRLGLPGYGTDAAFAPFEDLVIDHPDGSGALGFGTWMAPVGDVNGDGYPDILVGGDPAQGAPAAVLIY